VPSNGTTSHRHALRVQLLRHQHHRIGAERVADQNVGAAIAGAVFLQDGADHRFRDRMIVDARIDAVSRDLRGQLVHA